MSAAAAPWSVKGIDPKAREIAKDLARRSGMTLGEWLSTMIIDDEDDDGVTPLPRRPHAAETIDRRGRARRIDDAYEPTRDQTVDRRAADSRDRRQDARGYPMEPARDETLHRVAASVDAIAARLEAAERRSTVAVQGVDQAVAALLRRLEEQDELRDAQSRRIDDVADELREGTKRLRAFEKDVGPKTAESFGKMETSIAAVTSRLYDIEERQRLASVDLRQRMEAVEAAAGPGKESDLMAEVGARLDTAQIRTTEALRGLERSFAELDHRMRTAEARPVPTAAQTEPSRDTTRFETMAETLTRQLETSRAEMMRRLDATEAAARLDQVESGGRIERVERAMQGVGEQARLAEQRSVQAVEAMGQEVMRIARNLSGRVVAVDSQVADLGQQVGGFDKRIASIEGAGAERIDALERNLTARVERDMGRYAHAVEQRLNRTDDQNAMALEKLGGEITRISDRLADRIAQSERKSAQALEDIGRRLNESSDRIEHRHERSQGELSERMRLSEERTARLLIEARDSLEHRVAPVDKPTAAPATTPAPDWRAAAFPSDGFDLDDGWSQDPLPDEPPYAPAPKAAAPVAEAYAPPRVIEPEPLPVAIPVSVPEPVVTPQLTTPAATAKAEPFGSPAPFGGFGGAQVEDALDATAAPAPDAMDLDGNTDDFDAETEFVDARALRAGAAAGRAAATRSTIDAARAAMNTPVAAEAPPKPGFLGFKRGGKSKLQERLDKQATRDGSTVRKALLASVIGAAAVGSIYATGRLTGIELDLAQADGADTAQAALPMAAMALTAPPVANAEVLALYEDGSERIDAGDLGGLEPLTQAAGMGHVPAQLKLIGLYQTGSNGVVQDQTESRLWARRAAEAGDARGMHAFGMYLYDGVGGEENPREALRWLIKAANLGLIDSQFNAARIYETGEPGVPADPAEALKWYMVAARTGDAEAQGAVQRVTPLVPADQRRAARAEAEAFTAEG